MDRSELLEALPPYLNRYTMIKRNQDVFDIVAEVLAAHEAFKPDYDLIAPYFSGLSQMETLKKIFAFIKSNIRYQIEPEKSQTTKSPSALLNQSCGDCKHYAGFICGVLDALNRRGASFKFAYRFASYSIFDKTPGHVFAVAWIDGKEVWIDPVLKTFDERLQPSYILDKLVKNSNSMLSRVSGITDFQTPFLDDAAADVPEDIRQAIELLLQYNILNSEGLVNDVLLQSLAGKISDQTFEAITAARLLLHEKATVGNIFADIWHGFKAVSLMVPRNAYLSMVALNVFGLASKWAKAIYMPDGKTLDPNGFKQMADKWTSLGGKRMNLKLAIDSGAHKPKILGSTNAVGVAVAIPAWVAAASAIIAALTPLLTSILKGKEGMDYSNSGIPEYGAYTTPTTAGGGIMEFIQANPLIVGAVGLGAVYFLSKNKK